VRALNDDSTWVIQPRHEERRVKKKFMSAAAVPVLHCLSVNREGIGCLDEVALDSTRNVNLEFSSSSKSAARLVIVSSSSLSLRAAA
jgi:hypothetical protein